MLMLSLIASQFRIRACIKEGPLFKYPYILFAGTNSITFKIALEHYFALEFSTKLDLRNVPNAICELF